MSILASFKKLVGSKQVLLDSGSTDSMVKVEAEESGENINLGKFVFIMGQLALLALIIRQFQIQSGAFLRVALLAFIGFSIHYFLPLRCRSSL